MALIGRSRGKMRNICISFVLAAEAARPVHVLLILLIKFSSVYL